MTALIRRTEIRSISLLHGGSWELLQGRKYRRRKRWVGRGREKNRGWRRLGRKRRDLEAEHILLSNVDCKQALRR